MKRRKLLIAALDENAYQKANTVLETVPLEIVSLSDCGVKDSFESAKECGEQTGLLTLLDNTLYDPIEKTSYTVDGRSTGESLARIKYHIQNTYCGKHIVVPFGLIIKDGKVFMQLRNDPHRPEYHKKWEFPGGGMEMGETLAGNVVREVMEETGYMVEIVRQLNYIAVETHIAPTYQYQVYLIPFVCRVIGGDGMHRDEEVLETGWFSAEEVFEHDLLGTNVKIYREILPELKSVIEEFSL